MPILDQDGKPFQNAPNEPTARDYTEGVDYIVTKWDVYDNYECVHCQFASLYKEKLHEHFQYEIYHQHKWAHPVPKSEQIVTSGPTTAVY